MLRHVLGAVNAILIGQRFDLETQQVADGVRRAVDALVADIRHRDDAAAEGGKSS